MISETRTELSLVPGMALSQAGASSVTVQQHGTSYCLERLSPGTLAALLRLGQGAASLATLQRTAAEQGRGVSELDFQRALHQLDRAGLLRRTVWAGDQALASCTPVAQPCSFIPGLAKPDQAYVLSRLAYTRVQHGELIIETPCSRAMVQLHDPRIGAALAALAAPHDSTALARWTGTLDRASLLEVLTLLLNAQVLLGATARPSEADPQTPLGRWEFHDLLFHTRSRGGRHRNAYGGTFHLREQLPALPLRQPTPDGMLALPRPDMQQLNQHDRPFSLVLEKRRSLRRFADQPISVEQLGEFLYRSARICHTFELSGDGMERALSPCASGGAIHELEIYPVVRRCAGLEPGIYRYNRIDHGLTRLAGWSSQAERLIQQAGWSGDPRDQPTAPPADQIQVYLVITARFGRLQWKYQSVAYATVLKDVGALYQTMYLVATAMGLAPCALGGGDSDLFCAATGLDYYAESSVGEFVLGAPAPDASGPW